MAYKITLEEENLRKTIASNLKRLMYERDMSQTELAEKLGVTQAAVSAWCSGIRMPKAEMIDMICNIMQINRSQLVEKYQYRKIEVDEKQKPSTGSFTMEDILLAQKIARLDKYRRNLIAHIIETEPEQ